MVKRTYLQKVMSIGSQLKIRMKIARLSSNFSVNKICRHHRTLTSRTKHAHHQYSTVVSRRRRMFFSIELLFVHQVQVLHAAAAADKKIHQHTFVFFHNSNSREWNASQTRTYLTVHNAVNNKHKGVPGSLYVRLSCAVAKKAVVRPSQSPLKRSQRDRLCEFRR